MLSAGVVEEGTGAAEAIFFFLVIFIDARLTYSGPSGTQRKQTKNRRGMGQCEAFARV